jgi:hypothetical protein
MTPEQHARQQIDAELGASALRQECDELTAIFVTTLKLSKENSPRFLIHLS